MPNFFDNPDYRNIFERRFLERVLNGVNPDSLLPKGFIKSDMNHLLFFIEEADFYRSIWPIFLRGMIVPDDINSFRLLQYQPNLALNSESTPIDAEAIHLKGSRYIYWAKKEKTFLNKIIKHYRDLDLELDIYKTEVLDTKNKEKAEEKVYETLVDLHTGLKDKLGDDKLSGNYILIQYYEKAKEILFELYGINSPMKILANDCVREEGMEEGHYSCQSDLSLDEVLEKVNLGPHEMNFIKDFIAWDQAHHNEKMNLFDIGKALKEIIKIRIPDFKIFTGNRINIRDIPQYLEKEFQHSPFQYQAAELSWEHMMEELSDFNSYVSTGEGGLSQRQIRSIVKDAVKKISEKFEEKFEQIDQLEAQRKLLRSIIGF